MRISRACVYGIAATIQLSPGSDKPPIPCSELAKQGPMPERFLLQVLRNLVNEGILKSTRGVDGGYRLARSLQDIYLTDVIEAIDGPIDIEAGALETLPDDVAKTLSNKLEKAHKKLCDELKEVTLADILKRSSQPSQVSSKRRKLALSARN